MFTFLLRVSRPFKYLILSIVLLNLFRAAGHNISRYLLKKIADVNSCLIQDVYSYLYNTMLQYLLFGLILLIVYRLLQICTFKFVPKQEEFILLYLTKKMFTHSVSFYKKNFMGNITNRVNNILILPDLLSKFLSTVLYGFFSLLLMILNLYTIDPIFILFLFLWAVVFVASMIIFIMKKSNLTKNVSDAKSKVLGEIVDAISHASIVSLFVSSNYEINRIKSFTKIFVQKTQKEGWFLLIISTIQNLSYMIYEIFCVIFLLQGYTKGRYTIGDFILILSINWQAIHLLYDISEELKRSWQKSVNISAGLKIIDIPSEIVDNKDAKDIIINSGEIVFDNVCFAYQKSKILFDHLSISIKAKQKVGLVGYSGSGKSTFINLILRLFDIDGGQILIDNQNIKNVTQDSLHESIGVIPQDCSLFNRSIMDNIRYGDLDKSNEDVLEAAKKAHLHDIIERLSHKYDTIVGDKGNKLSGGQKQLVSVARAILKDAPILVLDEATSHLDLITEKKLEQSFYDIMEGKTVLAIAHRLTTILSMDRILVFDKGKIIQDGNHSELILQEGLYKQLWNAQINGFLPKDKK